MANRFTFFIDGHSAYGPIPPPKPLTAIEKLERERDQMRAALKQAGEEIEKLGLRPMIYATVLKVVGKEKVIIGASGKRVEVEFPKGTTLAVGDTVRCMGETLQIFDRVADDDARAGEILPLKSVFSDGTGEIERGGGSRRIMLPMKCDVGDRVVVDDMAQIAIANLGPEPSSCIFGEETGVTWDDIGGLAEAKQSMREAIEGPIKNKKLFERFKKKPTRGVLLYGPPGCGKTMLGKAAASSIAEMHGAKAKGGFFYVKGPEVLNMFVGNSEANIRKMFDDARRHEKQSGFPAVLFIDEADAILGHRGSRGEHLPGMERTTVPQFLSEMDGLEDSGAIVILATNRPNSLDPAVVRDGRVDRRIGVTRPSPKDATAIAERAFTEKPRKASAQELAELLVERLFDEELALLRLGKEGEHRFTLAHTVNGAMIVGTVERATSIAMRRNADYIEKQDVEAAVARTFAESKDINHDEELSEFVATIPRATATHESSVPSH